MLSFEIFPWLSQYKFKKALFSWYLSTGGMDGRMAECAEYSINTHFGKTITFNYGFLQIKMVNAWVRGAPRRLPVAILPYSRSLSRLFDGSYIYLTQAWDKGKVIYCWPNSLLYRYGKKEKRWIKCQMPGWGGHPDIWLNNLTANLRELQEDWLAKFPDSGTPTGTRTRISALGEPRSVHWAIGANVVPAAGERLRKRQL